MFKQHAISNTHPAQRGFMSGRIFLGNVVDLDAAARIHSMHFMFQGYNPVDQVKWLPILALFDFAAAFPSIIHGWIFCCLRHRGFPPGFICFIEAIYHKAHACAFVGGHTKILFYFLAGVLQGCPASAFLFNLAVDPFLNFLQISLAVRSGGILRACADDIGAALRTLATLKRLHPVFTQAHELAGLGLKPPKCIIIPLAPFSDALVAGIKTWLATHIPDWVIFSVKDAAKYLGFFLGPAAGKHQWIAPIKKYMDRATAINASQAAVSLCSYSYNVRALPTLTYIAQLAFLPDGFAQIERTSLQTILHTATNGEFWLIKVPPSPPILENGWPRLCG